LFDADDLDHQEYLGETLKKSRRKKRRLFIPNARVAVVSKQKPAALNVILKRCAETGIKPIVDACRFEIEGATQDGKMIAAFRTANEIYENVCLNLRGRHQLENAATAIVTAENLKRFFNHARCNHRRFGNRDARRKARNSRKYFIRRRSQRSRRKSSR
jgi:folylpolyglutamate synthase/dihydropteroate synthase